MKTNYGKLKDLKLMKRIINAEKAEFKKMKVAFTIILAAVFLSSSCGHKEIKDLMNSYIPSEMNLLEKKFVRTVQMSDVNGLSQFFSGEGNNSFCINFIGERIYTAVCSYHTVPMSMLKSELQNKKGLLYELYFDTERLRNRGYFGKNILSLKDALDKKMVGKASDISNEEKFIYHTDGNYFFRMSITYETVTWKNNEKVKYFNHYLDIQEGTGILSEEQEIIDSIKGDKPEVLVKYFDEELRFGLMHEDFIFKEKDFSEFANKQGKLYEMVFGKPTIFGHKEPADALDSGFCYQIFKEDKVAIKMDRPILTTDYYRHDITARKNHSANSCSIMLAEVYPDGVKREKIKIKAFFQ